MKRPPSQKSKKQQGVSPVSAPKVAVTLNKMVNGKYLYFDLSFYANHCQSGLTSMRRLQKFMLEALIKVSLPDART